MEREKIKKFLDFESAIYKIYPEYKKRNFPETIKDDILIIDIDGVLLNFDIKLFLKGLYFYLFSKAKFNKFIKENKIPLKYLLMIKRLVDKGCKIIILSSRIIDKEKDYFPYISEDFVRKMKERGIEIVLMKKYGFDFGSLDDFLEKLDRKRIIYLGSGIFDKRIFNKLKKKMKEKDLFYFDIGFNKVF